MTTYWLSDPCSIFNSFNINPFLGKDKNFKYNSLTRLIVLATIILSLTYEKNRIDILIAGGISLILSVIIYLTSYNSRIKLPERENRGKKSNETSENIKGDAIERLNTGKSVGKASLDADTDMKAQGRFKLSMGEKINEKDKIEYRKKRVEETGDRIMEGVLKYHDNMYGPGLNF